MFLTYVFIIVNFLTTCVMAHEFKVEVIDPPLVPHVSNYISTVKELCPKFKFSKNYVIELTEELSKDEWIGVCVHKINGFHIQIRKSWWNENPSYEIRQELINHEMTHCLLFKEHSPDASNYMYEYLTPMSSSDYSPQVRQDIKDYCGKKWTE